MTALTYEEAQERSRLIDVFGYQVELDVTRGDDVFGSVTVVRFGCRAPGTGTFIEIRPAQLRRVVLNGQDVDPATLTANRLPLTDLRAINELRVEADMGYSRTGSGLHRFTDAADGEAYLALHGVHADITVVVLRGGLRGRTRRRDRRPRSRRSGLRRGRRRTS